MKMSEKMALRLHLMMWGDMQKELGDNPSGDERVEYKRKWVKENFPSLNVDSNCWLCEYTIEDTGSRSCDNCPIVWGATDSVFGICSCDLHNNVSYLRSPISEILALPARNPELQYIVDSFNMKSEYVDKIEHDSYDKGITDANVVYDRFKQWLSDESGIEATESIVRHAEALREQAAKDFAKQLDAAFKRGLDEAMEKILKGEIQSDTVKKIEKKGYNKAVDDMCKEAGVARTPFLNLNVSNIKDVGFKESKDAFIEAAKMKDCGVSNWSYWPSIIRAFKDKVEAEYKKEHPAPTPVSMEALADESGLSADRTVREHIDAIYKKGSDEALYYICTEADIDEPEPLEAKKIVDAIKAATLETYFVDHPQAKYWCKYDVDQAFKQYAKEQMKPLKEMNDRLNKRYILAKSALAHESGLDSDRPVDDHIREIVRKAMKTGAADERERIMEKIEEMLDE